MKREREKRTKKLKIERGFPKKSAPRQNLGLGSEIFARHKTEANTLDVRKNMRVPPPQLKRAALSQMDGTEPAHVLIGDSESAMSGRLRREYKPSRLGHHRIKQIEKKKRERERRTTKLEIERPSARYRLQDEI